MFKHILSIFFLVTGCIILENTSEPMMMSHDSMHSHHQSMHSDQGGHSHQSDGSATESENEGGGHQGHQKMMNFPIELFKRFISEAFPSNDDSDDGKHSYQPDGEPAEEEADHQQPKILTKLLADIIPEDLPEKEVSGDHSSHHSEPPAATEYTADVLPEDEHNFLVDLLATSISDGFITSDVFGDLAVFRVNENPGDLLYRVGSGFLARAGVYNPDLADIAKDAIDKAGFVDSQLFFGAVANMVARFFFEAGLVKNSERVTYLSLRTLGAVDLVGCEEGVWDTESVMNSVAGGLFNLFLSLELVQFDRLADLFYFFAEEVDRISHDIVYFKAEEHPVEL